MPSINYQHFANENRELKEDNRILERENEEMRGAVNDLLSELSCRGDLQAVFVVKKHWKWYRGMKEWGGG